MIALELRLTHGYVGTYKHLDKWLTLGTIDEIGSRELPLSTEEENDHCEPKRREVFVLVSINQKEADFYNRWLESGDWLAEVGAFEQWVDRQIALAIGDVYSSSGCAHEYDCCGCRSYSASDAQRIARGEKDLWRVVVGSSRNF
jgi:hypothetical protein